MIPPVGVRQWVLTVPWARRLHLARHPALVRGVLQLAIEEIFAWVEGDLARRGSPRGRTGSVTAVQRSGSALRLNVHFHILVLDGGFFEDSPPGSALRCRPAHPPTTADMQALVTRIAQRAEDWLASQGYGPDDVPDSDPEDGAELAQAASLAGRVGLGRRAGPGAPLA